MVTRWFGAACVLGVFVVLIVGAVSGQQQASTYRLIGSPTTYAQYYAWHACLNGTLAFEFKTHEPSGLLLYAQSLPHKYVQMSLVDGRVRVRMRLGEKDSPRGEFLVQARASPRLNDEKWHELRFTRLNERTVMEVDGEASFHVHNDANLDASDLFFGAAEHEYTLSASNGPYIYNGYFYELFSKKKRI